MLSNEFIAEWKYLEQYFSFRYGRGLLRFVRGGKIRLLGLVLFGAELDPEHRRGFGLELVKMYIV